MPDPFVLAIGLTIITVVLALVVAPEGSLPNVIGSWYRGIFEILTFAFQMILILATGHALAHAPAISRFLRWLVSLAKTENGAIVLTFLVAAFASLLNWGFGLVVSAILAREVARSVKGIDFGWVVAAAYSGFVVWASGVSSSIAITQASHGNTLNIVEKHTGQLLPISDTVFASFNWVPTLIVILVMPLVFIAIRPHGSDVQPYVPQPELPPPPEPLSNSPARRMDRSPLFNLFLLAFGIAVVILLYVQGKFSFDVNMIILVFLIAGIALHGTPVAYGNAMKNAAKQTGSMMLQYPFYGGIMGIMHYTGLADVISKVFVAISSAHTLPFWSYICSLIITFFVPSGGGHWAVQGPFVVPAAVQLHSSLPASAMAVAMGEQVANMLQPFWALPVVAMAGIGIQRVMGVTVFTFVVAGLIYGAGLLLLG
ncbi:MAG: short-chain fatty acid transporter [Acetobacteraceae bacterium]|nr:short-chain fatty acid transporter [Acetobacteraceae bacterium]